MGIGVLWGRRELLEELPPWQAGGEMVSEVWLDRATWQPPPHKFEAGTPDVAAAVGLGAAIDYLDGLGREKAVAHERALHAELRAALKSVPKLRLLGEPARACAVASFTIGQWHAHDVGAALDQQGIAVRTGHLCCQPLLRRLGVTATVRASLGVYNRREDVAALAAALGRLPELL
jgi:cysteine desulfurase/selenocysteine lyase